MIIQLPFSSEVLLIGTTDIRSPAKKKHLYMAEHVPTLLCVYLSNWHCIFFILASNGETRQEKTQLYKLCLNHTARQNGTL